LDKRGSFVGKLVLGGQDINLKQLQSGVAWVYRAYFNELTKEDRVVHLEAEAQSKALLLAYGGDSNPVEP
jgi:endonuclease YncB( thermonuclease family)